MASIDKFNDHCWKDVVPEADLKLYAGWRRETHVGSQPALLAIDLYDLVYRGGPHSPYELNDRYPGTCGIHAHRAIAPTQRLIAAARSAEQTASPGSSSGRYPGTTTVSASASASRSRSACIA